MNVRFSRISAVVVALMLPLLASAQARITAVAQPDPAHGAYVIAASANGDALCRDATPDEASRINGRVNVPLRVFGEERGRMRANHEGESHGLNIILRGTAQLDAQPAAKAAFERAAEIWEARIANPLTVYVDVDYGPTRFGQAFPENVIASATSASWLYDDGGYGELRPLLVGRADNATEAAIYAALPLDSVPTDAPEGAISKFGAASMLLRALDVFPADANDDEPDDADDRTPNIGFNSAFSYDFDPDDGISTGRKDFVGVVVHELGHMLGFSSRVGAGELGATVTVAPAIMDLFRFRPGVTLGTFGTSNRILSTGGDQIFYGGGEELPFSTGNPRGENGDGQQASHWKDDSQSPFRFVGIMDPTLSNNRRVEITKYDLEAFGMMGYDIVSEGCAELEPNDTIPTANAIPFSTQCRGTAGRQESFNFQVAFEGTTQAGRLHDIYAVTLPAPAKLNVTMAFTNAAADLDVYLITPAGDDVQILADSITDELTENFESNTLPAGTYYVAVSAFDGTSTYTLTVNPIGLPPPVPAPPTALTATTLTKNSIRLSWTDNANNETGYTVEQKVAGGAYAEVASLGANVTTTDISGLSANTTYTFRVRARNEGGNSEYTGEASAKTHSEPFVCAPNDTTVCLLSNRFQVSVAYVNQFAVPPQPGNFRAGRLLQGVQNPDTGLFGFSSAQAVEVVVRIQDARPFAPRFDIYYGGMTDVEYTVTVTDSQTGVTRTYRNPPGTVGGGVDRATFPATGAVSTDYSMTSDDFSNGVELKAADLRPNAGPCVANGTTVCLLNERFLVTIAYLNQFAVPPVPGTFAAGRLLQGSQNPDVGLFGFSSPTAVEVIVRIQDARPFAPRFDIYYGGMTDVGYTVTVTDTQTGVTRQYTNAPGTVGGGLDRTSFPAL